jgi:hypothetical protein
MHAQVRVGRGPIRPHPAPSQRHSFFDSLIRYKTVTQANPPPFPSYTHTLRALAAKLLGPVGVLGQVVAANGRPAALDRLDEVAHFQRGLEELVAVQVGPRLLYRLRVAG